MNNIPNIISVSRGITALAMLLFPVFSGPFWALYCWCGFSDMIDGTLARKMNATSELGSRIDSVADLVFAICSAIIILPSVDLPLWVWIWIATIGITKLAGVGIGSFRHRQFTILHSISNRLTGILLLCLPFAIVWVDAFIPTVIICISATTSLFEDFRKGCEQLE